MGSKKVTKPTDEATNSAVESVKNIADLGKTELERKKKVDPGVE